MINSLEKETMRRSRENLLNTLTQAGARFRGNYCTCPFHEDRHPSAGIYEQDGIWRFKCQACAVGGDIFDMQAKITGTTPAEQLKKLSVPRQSPAKPGFANLVSVKEYLTKAVGAIESEHPYNTADGDIAYYVYRIQTPTKKQFRPVSLSDSGYVLKMPSKPWILYNLPEVVKAETVIVCEGEKKVDCLHRYGFTGTTSSDGSLNSKYTDWKPLAGKTVVIWRDNDVEGIRYLADVQSILQNLEPVPRISIVDPAQLDLAEKEDVVDFVEQLKVLGKTDAEITSAIESAIKSAKPVSVSNQVRQRIADISAGRYYAVSLPWDLTYNITKALLPNTVTKFVGNSGATKSFAMLQLFSHFMKSGIKSALFEIEEDLTYHLTRALAQKTGQGWLTDADLVKDRAGEADRLAQDNAGYIEDMGRVLYSMPTESVTLDLLADWISEQARRGCRVIGVDPVTAAARTGDAWKADEKFLSAVKKTATNFRCSVILVSHPIKSVSFPDMSQIAGGAAYNRFCQTILWLEMHDEKTSQVKTCCGTDEIEHNRTLYCLKARNGKGGGYKLAFDFDSESLTLRELGLIVKAKK